ncbi:MAG: hypothetical protein IJL06_03950, partial [Kiritimatiellae bacterium]|nr:hypothetical protein [Kiritimatiellia bacterium]
MKKLALLVSLLAFVVVPAHAEDPATPVFSCRANIGESGSFPVVRDWRLRYGPDEATADGIPKWSVELVKGDDPRNRLLPNRWHGLQPCEVAPALVATNETRVLPVRGGPWLLRLTLEDVGVGEDGAVRGRASMEL